MSEALPGMPKPASQPARTRDASVVLMYRRQGAGGVAVFWIKREKALRFAGGFYAFPGGRVDAADSEIAVEGAEGHDAALVASAARELLEETGVLVGVGADKVSARHRADMRRALLDRKAKFADLLKQHGVQLRKRDFVDAGRWITPPFLPVRFDARMFLVEAPAAQDAEVWPGELSEGRWIKPAEAIELWNQGKSLMHPPNLHAMRVMSTFTTPEDAAQRLSTPQNCPGHVATRIEFQRGIHLFPLETETLPPATHTNAYVVGNGELLIVDPGAKEVRQYARLLALVAGMAAEGKRPKAIFLTHHHADHIGGALAVKERLKIPIWCHERTAERLPKGAADRLLVDDELIDLQGLPAMKLRVLHTPGHARGHLCLVDEATKAAIVGDMVAGVGTIVIDPPEGDMTDYLAQLERLKNLPVTTVYPAHGAAIPDGPGKLEEYLLHRQHRERLVFDALPKMGATLPEVVKQAYADTPEVMHPIAERSAQAILIKLVRDGRVVRKDDRYFHA